MVNAQVGEVRTLHRGNRTLILLREQDGNQVVEKSLLDFANVRAERAALFAESQRQHLARGEGIVPILSPPQVLEGTSAGETKRLLRPFIRGRTLREILSTQRVIPKRAKDWIEKLATIVAHVHALSDCDGNPLGMIHRDITPGNVLIDNCDRVWLNDFGLARLAADPPLADNETLQGTRSFLSPELLAGDQPVFSSDVFQVGLLLAHLLDPGGPSDASDPVRRKWATALLEPYGLADVAAKDPTTRPTAIQFRMKLQAVYEKNLEKASPSSLLPQRLRRFWTWPLEDRSKS